ncbi:MAG: nickel-responsive transcriptional regulator NikR [Syntrophus sp. (in: bacteria)]|nr:nickel-responsive transcriptional regulator NikR [Syntrophus sp. (in: bacteria)]
MAEIVRFGVSLEKTLLKQFDRRIEEQGYTNRSEAIRDLIRQELLKKEWEEDQEVAGSITYTYDHHQRDLLNKIIDVQHDFQDVIKSTQHIHLNHDNCLEIIAVKGSSTLISNLSHALKALKGVRHGSLSISGIGRIAQR